MPKVTRGRAGSPPGVTTTLLLLQAFFLISLLRLPVTAQPPMLTPSSDENSVDVTLIQEYQKGGPAAVREILRAHSGHTKEIWRMLIARAAALNTQNLARSLTLYRVALVVAEEMRDAGVEATTYYQLGLAFSELKRLGEATQALEKSEKLFTAARLSRGVAYARADLAALCFVLQKFDEAEVYASGALEVVANLKKRAGADGGWPHQYAEAGALSTLGQLRMREGKHGQAEEMVTRALSLYQELDGGGGKYAYEIIENTEAVGRILFISGDNRRALVYLMRAVDLAQGHPRRDRLASALNSLGVLYLEMEDYDKAAASLRRSLEIYEETGDGRECARVLLNLGVIELREKRHARALELLGEALRRARGGWGP